METREEEPCALRLESEVSARTNDFFLNMYFQTLLVKGLEEMSPKVMITYNV